MAQPIRAGEPSVENGPQTEVRMCAGRPTFFLDGAPYTKPLFATYVPTEHYYATMANIGINLFNFQTNCGQDPYGHSRPTWPQPGQRDFSEIDERMNAVLAVNPNALVLPRIYIGTPDWWRQQHPEEMQVLSHGGLEYREGFAPGVVSGGRSYASLCSVTWRRDMGEALRNTVRYFVNGPYGDHVFGFEIAALATEEWYHWSCNQDQLADYSPHMAKTFREWLREKYQVDTALRDAWSDTSVTFDTASVPTITARMADRARTFRDPSTEMPVIDFYQFYNELVAETIDYFAGIVKEETQRRKVVGAFYNYFYEFNGNPEFGHNAGYVILRSPNIDFICAPPSYFERQSGGVEAYRRPYLSATLHGKLWFHDNDAATYLFPDIMKKFSTIENAEIQRLVTALGVTDTAQESEWLLQRAAGFTLSEGIFESFFDLHGGYYDNPRLLECLGRIAAMLDRSADYDRKSIAEILVIADERSASYGAFQIETKGDAFPNRLNRSLLTHQPGLIRSGAPFDAIYLDDLDLVDVAQYRLVVFLNTYAMDDHQRHLVDERIKGSDRLVVWCYAPGLFSGSSVSSQAMSELIGMSMAVSADETLIRPVSNLTDVGKAWFEERGVNLDAAVLGQDEPVCKRVEVRDEGVIALGRNTHFNAVTLALRKFPNWTSVYTISSVMPPAFWRALAREAGVHLYLDSDDALYANASYLTVHAAEKGERLIRFPRPVNVYNASTEGLYYPGVTEFQYSFMPGETAVFRYDTAVSDK